MNLKLLKSSEKVLLARIHSLGRRRLRPMAGNVYHAADLQLDVFSRKVTRAGRPIKLTPTEFSLLELVLAHKNKVLSKAFIPEAIWGIDFERRTNLISVYINYLRGKIDKGFDLPLIHMVVPGGSKKKPR
jgi:two-component system copper resistance phosphate regulon response regulator CusR